MNHSITSPFRGIRRCMRGAGLRRTAFMAVATGLLFAASARPLDAQDPSRATKMVVQAGDTLSDIAVRFYGSAAAVDRIIAANKLADSNFIVAGTVLLLPAPDAPVATAAASSANGARIVAVEPGDSLSVISLRAYGTAAYASALAALNGINDVNLVYAGMKLTVPATPPDTATAASAAARGGPLAGRRICLDPGHGGSDEPGAVFDFGDGRLLREADVTLDMARALRGWLQADGASVTMTRTSARQCATPPAPTSPSRSISTA